MPQYTSLFPLIAQSVARVICRWRVRVFSRRQTHESFSRWIKRNLKKLSCLTRLSARQKAENGKTRRGFLKLHGHISWAIAFPWSCTKTYTNIHARRKWNISLYFLQDKQFRISRLCLGSWQRCRIETPLKSTKKWNRYRSLALKSSIMFLRTVYSFHKRYSYGPK